VEQAPDRAKPKKGGMLCCGLREHEIICRLSSAWSDKTQQETCDQTIRLCREMSGTCSGSMLRSTSWTSQTWFSTAMSSAAWQSKRIRATTPCGTPPLLSVQDII
jgi:hypothetical protein